MRVALVIAIAPLAFSRWLPAHVSLAASWSQFWRIYPKLDLIDPIYKGLPGVRFCASASAKAPASIGSLCDVSLSSSVLEGMSLPNLCAGSVALDWHG